MKIEIDYDTKEILFEGSRNIKSLIDDIKLILPNDWEDYKLVCKEREVKVTNIFKFGSDKIVETSLPPYPNFLPPPYIIY